MTSRPWPIDPATGRGLGCSRLGVDNKIEKFEWNLKPTLGKFPVPGSYWKVEESKAFSSILGDGSRFRIRKPAFCGLLYFISF